MYVRRVTLRQPMQVFPVLISPTQKGKEFRSMIDKFNTIALTIYRLFEAKFL